MFDIGIIEYGSVVVENGLIIFVGLDVEVECYVYILNGYINMIDVLGKIVILGLIDVYIYIVFGGSCEKELEMWLNGVKYIDILKVGGGIF